MGQIWVNPGTNAASVRAGRLSGGSKADACRASDDGTVEAHETLQDYGPHTRAPYEVGAAKTKACALARRGTGGRTEESLTPWLAETKAPGRITASRQPPSQTSSVATLRELFDGAV